MAVDAAVATRAARMRAAWWAMALSTVLSLAATAAAQTAAGAATQPAAPEDAADPLGRDTPRGTIAGFNRAVHAEDFVAAAQYLQATAAQRRNLERLARDLTDLMDRYYTGAITAVSAEPSGATTDGLALDREHVTLTMAGDPVDLELVRVKDGQGGLVWLISSRTLARVPALRRSAGETWLERIMPQSLVDATLFGVPWARWVAWAATVIVPFAALQLMASVVMAIARRVVRSPTRRVLLDTWSSGLRALAIAVVTLALHLALLPSLGFSLRFRLAYSRVALVVLVLALAWLLWRLMALSFAHARLLAQHKGQHGVRSLLLLVERVSKTIVVLLAIFALLTLAGVDTSTALAGVGIGGVALALGAQKSVENLLGGVFLITDRALAVGDLCSVSNRLGFVEDITMRSVRLRTIEQTLLSVPAGVLSQSMLENFATRRKILIQSTLRLRYDTTADQLRAILSAVRALLEERADIESDSARVRLVDFGVRAIELELFAYVLTADLLKFLAVREDVLLQVTAIVEASGAAFAQPTLIHDDRALDPAVDTPAPGGRETPTVHSVTSGAA